MPIDSRSSRHSASPGASQRVLLLASFLLPAFVFASRPAGALAQAETSALTQTETQTEAQTEAQTGTQQQAFLAPSAAGSPNINAPSFLLASISPSAVVRSSPKLGSEEQRNTACENGTLRGKPCRVSWVRVVSSSLIFLAAQHGGNIYMDDDTRNELTHGDFWAKYRYCVEHYRWSRWKDDDPFGVDYIGHPMMGSVTSSIYEQNDPKQRALTFENTPRYWKGRLKAMAYSAAYSAQWKIGPASEASIGNTGIGYYIRDRDGIWTNETGMQDFFITPIGGLAWNVGEDLIDRYLFARVARAHPHNRLLLVAAGLMTPTRAAANVSRLRAFYYRDEDDRHFYQPHLQAEVPQTAAEQR